MTEAVFNTAEESCNVSFLCYLIAPAWERMTFFFLTTSRPEPLGPPARLIFSPENLVLQ